MEIADIIKVRIEKINQYFLIVDYNGIKGNIHKNDLSWDGSISPLDFDIGEELEVKVDRIRETDEGQYLNLSLKKMGVSQLEKNKDKYKEGDLVKGTIIELRDYAVFLDIDEIQGMIYVSEVSWNQRTANVYSVGKVGDEVEARIIGVREDRNTLELSIKEVLGDPYKEIEKSHQIGDMVDVDVVGLFQTSGIGLLTTGVESSDEVFAKVNFKSVEGDLLLKGLNDEEKEGLVGEKIKVKITVLDVSRQNIRFEYRRDS